MGLGLGLITTMAITTTIGMVPAIIMAITTLIIPPIIHGVVIIGVVGVIGVTGITVGIIMAAATAADTITN